MQRQPFNEIEGLIKDLDKEKKSAHVNERDILRKLRSFYIAIKAKHRVE